jgi:uncharacterized membrane protein
MYNYGPYCDINFTPGTYQVVCRAKNSCGWGPYFTITVNVSGSYIIYYPNPVSDVLHIDFTAKSGETSRGMAGQSFDIRLYDGQGTQLRQTVAKGESVAQFDVSGLPNGTYYLHVYDGVNAKPEMYQIIVKH